MAKKKDPKLPLPLLDRVLKAITNAADELGKDPSQVTPLDLASNDYGITNWDLRKLGGLALIRNTHFPVEDRELSTIKALKDDKKYLNQLERDIVELSNLEASLSKALENTPAVKVKPYVPSKKSKVKRALNLVISDTHFGSDIKKEDTGRLDYGPVEEARRFAKIIEETIAYKLNHRNETHLNVLLMGDLIENLLHDHADGAPLTNQFGRALHLLAQGLGHLVNHFPSITVYCTTGNHGRNIARHKQRAVSQKWDSIETMLYIALKSKLSGYKNINFVIPKTPYLVYEVFGKKIFVTHGDTVLSIGNPGSSIKTGGMEDKINAINASLPDNEEYSVFIVGHHHVASCTHLSNGAVMITNGPLVPPNEFAVSLGLFEAACGQYLFESVEDYPVGDIRYIKVDSRDDKNKELSKIIAAWEGF